LTYSYLEPTTQTIPYVDLLQQLEITNVRELEDLIIDCIYQGIIKGRLDQQRKHLEIDFAIGRDLRPGQLETMIATLINWNQKAETLLHSIEDKIKFAQVHQQQVKDSKKSFDDKLEAVKLANSLDHGHAHEIPSDAFDDFAEARSRKKYV
jgi:COP9 signalosome complex subunit 7